MMRDTRLARLGILGGGQLARMTLQAAVNFGIDTAIFADARDSPAGRLTVHEFVGGWDDTEALRSFAAAVDVVTLENEFVPAEVLELLEQLGVRALPGAATLRAIQDKLVQKQTLAAAGLPVADFVAVRGPEDVAHAAGSWGWPVILKARRNGYDGYGNATVTEAAKIETALDRLGWPEREIMAERNVRFVRELAVLVARSSDEVVCYPVVETVQRNHICHLVRAPAPISRDTSGAAQRIALAAVAAVDGIGITAVELFEVAGGEVLINELAPRPHNSGHYSIDACITSQFENHVRAVLGLPLGASELRAPAVMVNLLGSRDGTAEPGGFDTALALPDTHVQMYGKRDVRRGRKMGHLTALGATLAEAEARALEAAAAIRV